MWTYRQRTGQLFNQFGNLIHAGYSGHGEGKNNPALEHVHNVGPIPQGRYSIGFPFDSSSHGPFCLRLAPLPGTDTFGRDGFLMHGDSIQHPGEASEGCIIMPRNVREEVYFSDDKILHVVE